MKDMLVYSTLYARIYACVAVAINSVCTITAFVLLFTEDVSVYWTSFSKSFQEDVLMQNGYADPVGMHEILRLSDPANPDHNALQNSSSHLNIVYGTTWYNWCWNDPTPRSGLPSILRMIEFHAFSQVLLRFTFVTSLSLRPIATYLRCAAVMSRLSSKGKISPVNLLVSSIIYASPALQFISTLAGSLILLWQQDLDFHELMWAPYYAFSFFYLLHMLVYSAVEILEPVRMNSVRVVARALLINGFCATIKPTLDMQMQFLNRKTCNANVPTSSALCEYACLLVITLFSLLEWTDIWDLQMTVVPNSDELVIMHKNRVSTDDVELSNNDY